MIDLKAARYRIYALAGFGVRLGSFSISFKNVETSEIVQCKKAVWKVQSYAFGKRAKRILIADISNEGQYEILFNHPESLRIKRSNLPISSLFTKPLATENIEIFNTEKLGV